MHVNVLASSLLLSNISNSYGLVSQTITFLSVFITKMDWWTRRILDSDKTNSFTQNKSKKNPLTGDCLLADFFSNKDHENKSIYNSLRKTKCTG